jgi:hypothetical protein
LHLNEVEHEHLRRLMLASDEADVHTQARESTSSIRPELQRLLDALTEVPAYIVNKRLDIVGVNELGRALYSPMYDLFPHPVNTARFFFLAENASRAFWEDWDGTAASGVAILRAEHALRPNDRDLTALINELRQQSAQFRDRWATHEVHRHSTGFKIMNHPAAGHLELPYENMLLPADPDLSMMTYNPEPGTASWEALRLLQIWAREHQESPAWKAH